MLIIDWGEVTTELNSFFLLKILNTPNYESCTPLTYNIHHVTQKATVKWRNPSSILTIASEHENTSKFPFNFVSKEHALEEIEMLDSSKAIQESDILVKIIKGNKNLFAQLIWNFFNESLEKSKFPDCLKLENVTSVFKKGARTSKNNLRPAKFFWKCIVKISMWF